VTDLDREQLKRDRADALAVLHREQRVDGLHLLADAIRTLGPTFRAHGELMQIAVRDRNDNTITWRLIHVLEKLGSGSGPVTELLG
jgi:hypothetical protein